MEEQKKMIEAQQKTIHSHTMHIHALQNISQKQEKIIKDSSDKVYYYY